MTHFLENTIAETNVAQEIIYVKNWAGFDPIHKPWPMDRPHGLSDK